MRFPRLRILAILTGLLVLGTAVVSAGETKIGASGGISIPNLRGNESNIFTTGFTSRKGPFFGIFLEMSLTPRLSLVAALNFTSQGGLRRGLQPITMDLPDGLPIPPGTILYADFRNENILDYVEVPVMARLTFGTKLRFFLNAGPYVGLLTRARALTSGSSALYLDEAGTMPIVIPPATDPLIVNLAANTNVKDSLKSTNIGLAGGGGVMYPVGPGEIVVEAHFQLGLTTLQKNPETDGSSQTGAVIVSVGYSLPLGRKK